MRGRLLVGGITFCRGKERRGGEGKRKMWLGYRIVLLKRNYDESTL